MIRAIKHLIDGPDPGDVLFECRDCGTSLGTGSETCPECGSDGVVRYEL
ncbi:hypothetical protein ACFQDG_12220 [Natronoarchaeum mannanilyticum]|uniref:Small CPxCG-related zinc finger protein n=1 Tax=Natronoarchaeum mannanilyticum TaxID=926360 RepID=A0AAV3TD04_9EURY